MGENTENKDYQAFPCKVVGLRIGWILKEDQGKQLLFNILNSGNLDLFNIQSLNLIIEFLFQKYKYIILMVLFPLYLFAHISFAFLMIYNDLYLTELWNTKTEDNIIQGSTHNSVTKLRVRLLQLANMIATILQAVQMVIQIYQQGTAYFYKLYSFFDVLYIAQIVVTFVLVTMTFNNDYTAEEFEKYANWTRYIGCFGTLFLFCKASYFLSLFDQIAPLIDIIFQIIYDIKYFLLVLFIYIFMFAQMFQIISSLQTDFDNIDEGDKEKIAYTKLPSALWYALVLPFGGADNSAFALGDGKQKIILEGLFFGANFIISLHFLNMLIAIMGGTYGVRAEIGHQIMKRDHLKFVMDNWLLKLVAFRGIKRIEYLIAAIPLDETLNEEVSLQQFYDDFLEMRERLDTKFGRSQIIEKETQQMVIDMRASQRNSKK